ncbi:MAG: hypothetical protein H7Y06_09810, partial [Opitutaceae bacterium]|nr:hypothetical protein [Opitutaceae bacterium]
LDHLQIIIAVAGAIAYWLNARSKQKAGEAADYDGDGEPDTLAGGGGGAMREGEREMEQAEATRRIHEEIRRKIAERAGNNPGGGQATVPQLPPLPPQIPVRRREPELAHAALREERREETERESAAVLERQRALMDQLAALKARKTAEGVEAKAVWDLDNSAGTPARAHARVSEDVSLLAELRNARSLRKAIVLREVLGTPVGLR